MRFRLREFHGISVSLGCSPAPDLYPSRDTSSNLPRLRFAGIALPPRSGRSTTDARKQISDLRVTINSALGISTTKWMEAGSRLTAGTTKSSFTIHDDGSLTAPFLRNIAK